MTRAATPTHAWILLAATALAGCEEGALSRESLALLGGGTGEDTFEDGDWTIRLTRADVAFGPLYFCATPAADADLCPVALAEFADVAVVDALDAESAVLGEVVADSGTVRSATFDFGLPWLVTAQGPRSPRGALGGHSARFQGEATDGVRAFRFQLALDVTSANPGDIAVRGVRTTEQIDGDEDTVTVTFEPAAWWLGVDWEALADLAVLAPGARVDVAEDAPSASVVRTGMTSRAVPRFTWAPEGAEGP